MALSRVLLVLLLLGLAAPGRGWAGATPSSLSWVRLDGAEGCPAAAEMAQRVEALLGRPVFVAPGAADLTVEGRVEVTPADPGGSRWRVVLRLSDRDGEPQGERIVTSRSATCDELAEVAATTIALLIDPEGRPPDPPPPAPEPPAPRWTVEVDGALQAGLGTVPGVAVSGAGALRLTPPELFPLVVRGELVPFARKGAGLRVDFLRTVGGVELCPVGAGEGVRVEGCVGVDAGAIFVLASDAPLTATERVLVQGLGSGAVRAQVVGPLSMVTGLQVIVPLRRVEFVDAASGITVYRPAVVAGAVAIGLGLTL